MADVRVGGVRVDFTAGSQQFVAAVRRNGEALRRQRRAVNRLRRDVRRFNRSARDMINRFVSVRSAVALLAGGGGLGALVRRQAQYGASLVETSQRLGLNIEQLQLLQRVFTAEGLRLNAVNIGLQRFTRRLGDAAEGNRLLRGTFAALGVEIRNADGTLRDSADVLLDVADGLQGLDSQSQRVLLAFRLFDTEGVAFVNALQRGGGEMRASIERFRALGVVTLQQAERLKTLDQSFQNLANALRTGAAQAVAENTERFRELNAWLAETLPKTIRSLIELVDALARNFDTLLAVVNALLVIRFGPTVLRWAGSLGAVGVAARTAARGIRGVRGAIVGLAAAARAHPIGFLTAGFAALAVAITSVARATRLTRAQLNALSLDDLSQRLRLQEEQLARGFRARGRNKPRPGVQRERQEAIALTRAEIEKRERRERELSAALEAPGGGLDLKAFEAPVFTPPPARDTFARDLLEQSRQQRRRIKQRIELLGAEEGARARLAAQQQVANEFADEALRRQRAVNAAITESAAAQEAVNAAADAANATELAAALNRLKTVEAAVKAAEENRDALKDAAELQALILKTIVERNEAEAEYKQLIEQVDDVAEHVFDLADAAEASGQAFGDFIRDAVTGFRGIGDAAEELARRIISSLLEALVIAPLVEAITGGFKGILGVGSARHGGLHSGLTVVGEEGPELRDFRTPNRIYTTEQLGAALRTGGGDVYNFAPVIQSSDRQAVYGAVVELFPSFRDFVQAEVDTNMGRPSHTRQRARR